MNLLHFRVDGVVQGVGFRAFTQRHASELGITGWVRNLADGSVQGQAFGDEDDLRDLVSFLEIGPLSAKVDELSVMWDEADPLEETPESSNFQIRR